MWSFSRRSSRPDDPPAEIPRFAVRVNRVYVGLNKRNFTKSLYLYEATLARNRLRKDSTVVVRQIVVRHIEEASNIHAGVKYFYILLEQYYVNEPMDDLNKVLFTFAAYNCGPGRIKELRTEATAKGLDPNIWIDNVEVIAAARIGAEPVTYVSHIYKYYVAYKLIAVEEEQHQKAKESLKQTKP